MINKKKIWGIASTVLMSLSLIACGNGNDTAKDTPAEVPEGAPETWIADRTITGLVFQSAGDAGADTMSPEIAEYIKERTGITLELEAVTSDNSTEALVSGLAAGDLPDFIAFYLNHSGRPEFPPLLQAANEGMFHDISDELKAGETYGKYFEEGYLPRDTKDNIMMRDDHDGATYLVHMSIPKKPADPGRKLVGGPYIRTDIVEDLGIDPQEIVTTEQVHELLKQIAAAGYTDDNGAPITPLGPTVWGGADRAFIYQDLVWQGEGGEKFWKDDEGIKHESMTDFGERRVDFVHQLMSEGLMHPEFYTMEETRAAEGVTNRSFGIIADIHSQSPELQHEELRYQPLGPINFVYGDNDMVMAYKGGYAGWAVPSTTKNPEEIVRFADWLASEEGKMLYLYGLEGVHYELDEDGMPIPDKDLVALKDSDPDLAKKEGFRGVGAYWGEHLAWTDIDLLGDYGEANWGDKVRETDSNGSLTIPQKINELYGYEERFENKTVIDGLRPRAYVYEFEQETGYALDLALDRWDEELQKAYYAKSKEEAQDILNTAKQHLLDNGLEEFISYLEEQEANGEVIFY